MVESTLIGKVELGEVSLEYYRIYDDTKSEHQGRTTFRHILRLPDNDSNVAVCKMDTVGNNPSAMGHVEYQFLTEECEIPDDFNYDGLQADEIKEGSLKKS